MNTFHSKKPLLHSQQNEKKMEMQRKISQPAEASILNKRISVRERKLALLRDVGKLKKKLLYEENIRKTLEKAFNRPLGALPRLPPYLPQNTRELLAEVAVLEEEVVRLEDQVVNFRQDLYHEAAHVSSTINPKSPRISKLKHFRSSSPPEMCTKSPLAKLSRTLSRTASIKKPLLFHPVFEPSPEKKLQKARSVHSKESSSSNSEDSFEGYNMANKISEDILKCLCDIFMRLSKSRGRIMVSGKFSSILAMGFRHNTSEIDFRDPYCISSGIKTRNLGPYKHVSVIEASTIDLKRTTHATFLIERLKLLFGKLVMVDLKGLNHQQKLAFWINTYNACMMNAFLEHGIPDSPEMVVLLMQKATITVGGQLLDAITIEHFILRLPYHLKYNYPESGKQNERKACSSFGLDWSEPLVTFALSCGSWSSPAVKIYTASQVENELEVAKREYLQAAMGISMDNKLIIPKLLEWYHLDFAKNFEALVDWVCLQLPDELRNETVKCLERRGREPVSSIVEIMPYNFRFRYLIHK